MKKYIRNILIILFYVFALIFIFIYSSHYLQLMNSFEYESDEHMLAPAVVAFGGYLLVRYVVEFIQEIMLFIKSVKNKENKENE